MPIDGLGGLQRSVRNIKNNLGDNVEDAVRETAEATAATAKSNVGAQNAVWRGNLYRSISAEKRSTDNFARYTIVADVPYAAFVEFGTGPSRDNKTPLKFKFSAPSHTEELTKEITEWVMTKPLFFGPRTEAVAWKIARSISKEGTDPHPYMRPAWFQNEPIMIQRVHSAVRRTIRRA